MTVMIPALRATALAALLSLPVILPAPAVAGEPAWLPREVHEVRAYVYDYTQADTVSLLKNGKLHPGVINKGGARLDEEQVARLKRAIFQRAERRPGARCYMPHHGFVFHDKAGRPMGHIELCFQCGNVRYSPRGLRHTDWDWKALRALLGELDIPILKEDADYTRLFEQGVGKPPAGQP